MRVPCFSQQQLHGLRCLHQRPQRPLLSLPPCLAVPCANTAAAISRPSHPSCVPPHIPCRALCRNSALRHPAHPSPSLPCSALCNDSTLSYQPDKQRYQRIGEATELALRVFVEKVRRGGRAAGGQLASQGGCWWREADPAACGGGGRVVSSHPRNALYYYVLLAWVGVEHPHQTLDTQHLGHAASRTPPTGGRRIDVQVGIPADRPGSPHLAPARPAGTPANDYWQGAYARLAVLEFSRDRWVGARPRQGGASCLAAVPGVCLPPPPGHTHVTSHLPIPTLARVAPLSTPAHPLCPPPPRARCAPAGK